MAAHWSQVIYLEYTCQCWIYHNFLLMWSFLSIWSLLVRNSFIHLYWGCKKKCNVLTPSTSLFGCYRSLSLYFLYLLMLYGLCRNVGSHKVYWQQALWACWHTRKGARGECKSRQRGEVLKCHHSDHSWDFEPHCSQEIVVLSPLKNHTIGSYSKAIKSISWSTF